MSESHDFDLIVIGAGSGGVRLARMSAQRGARVAVVESPKVTMVAGSAAERLSVVKCMPVSNAHVSRKVAAR